MLSPRFLLQSCVTDLVGIPKLDAVHRKLYPARWLASSACASYMRGGACVHFDAECLVSRDKRCKYFERIVLPLADSESDLQAKRLAARKVYRTVFELPDAQAGRSCGDCGSDIGKGRRFCSDCARVRKRASNRRSARGTRSKAVPQ